MSEDLISRQAVLALAKDICVPVKDGSEYRHRCIDLLDVMEIPSAEPEERKKGKWEIARKQTKSPLLARCSECKHYEGVEWIVLDRPNFCPHCGAYMRDEYEYEYEDEGEE